jgi:putative restriction endonuclease
MRAYVGVTDWDWFDLLRAQPHLDEVNFWQPGGTKHFRALEPGGLFLFKLHSPRNFIVGGGLFAHSTLLPISLAWDAFGVANGAASLPEMRARVAKYRRDTTDPLADYTVGCVLLEQPFFFPEDQWIPAPSDWVPNIVQGRGYDLTRDTGLALWSQLRLRLAAQPQTRESETRYGKPSIVLPRLGQGSFRVLVTDAYERRCAVSAERTLPALDAAHIKPYATAGDHRIDNGLLLRRDLHALFDRGYITVTPEHKIEISRRIREEFENGRDYYQFDGKTLRMPGDPRHAPSREFLAWHNANVFRG